MSTSDPMQKDKKEFSETLNKISSQQSAVGIDAQLTHAIIIDYLQQLSKRIDHIEQLIKESNRITP